MEKLYSEENLIIPALFELYYNPDGMTTSMLIKKLTENLQPTGADAEILFGRKDSRFSQKVRNLISHKRLHPYVDLSKRGKDTLFIINEDGIATLKESEYYTLNRRDHQNKVEKKEEYEFDGEETFEEVENYDFIEKSYVSVENVNYTIYELKRKYDKTKKEREDGIEPQNGLILDDSFQRTGDVWGTKDKVKFIESILMDIPIPFIYLAEGKRGNLIVIDGRQRLTALFDFLDNKYPLRNIEFFPQLNGKKVKHLTNELETFKTKIEDYHLYVIKIKMSTPEEFKLQIFARVNKTGMQLNPQEIRHALHQGESTLLLEKISNKYEIINKKRMKDRYLAIRYIAMRLYYLNKLKNYDRERMVTYTTINTFLGEAMDALNTFTADQIEEVFNDFCYAYDTACDAWGEYAFRTKKDTPINMIIFEISLLLISLTKDAETAKIYLEKIKRIDLDKTQALNEDVETPFECNLKYHRDSKENFEQRIDWIRKIVGEEND